VVLHPIGIAGWFGLFVTSLNLIPAGQLDGGHVVYAATGRQTPLLGGVLAGIAVYLGIRVSPGWFLWAGIVAIMTRLGHPPTLDDGPPLEPGRLVGVVASLVLFVLTFVPEPFRIML
jgi:membrane-associated protease RseP (regulator of RpoE activity)